MRWNEKEPKVPQSCIPVVNSEEIILPAWLCEIEAELIGIIPRGAEVGSLGSWPVLQKYDRHMSR